MEFSVYRGLLEYHSGYFRSLLNGTFADSGMDHVTIRGTSITTFKIVNLWLNSGRLYAPGSCVSSFPLSYNDIFELYVFGDKYIIPRLKNAAVEAYIECIYHTWNGPSKSHIEYLYNNTPKGASLRKVIVETTIRFSRKTDFDEFPPAFQADMIRALREDGIKRTPTGSKAFWYNDIKHRICKFHDHREPCSSRT
jgi:hypothetical protein